ATSACPRLSSRGSMLSETMRRLSVVAGCTLLLCAGCASGHFGRQLTKVVGSPDCVEPLTDPGSYARTSHMPGTGFTAARVKRGVAHTGLRLRPMSLRFWKSIGITPYPQAAFNPALSNDPGKPPVSVIVAVYRSVSSAFTASRRYGPRARRSCDTHVR